MPTSSHDLLITAIETNSHHGVGILLQRFFPDSTPFACLRTTSLYNGDEPFGSAHHELCSRFLNLTETEAHLRRILALYDIRRILCVPYYREECIHAILAQRITGAPLCTFVMDDQNIFASGVPDHWAGDLLAASQLCLGISPEICAAYQKKFGREVHLLPPVLEKSDPLVPCYWHPEPAESVRAAMIGNVWTARRLTQLRALLRVSGLQIDWYGNGPKSTWLQGTPEEWEADQIHCMGFYPEEDLVASLASYPFILVPSGSLDADDDNHAFSRLSLPSRLLFLHASTDTPVLILGSAETAAARFVTRLGTGLCSSYEPAELQQQIQRLLDPNTRLIMRQNIRHWSKYFVLENAGQWIWDSLEAGRPRAAPFQDAFPAHAPPTGPWLEAITPGRSRPVWRQPQPRETFQDEHAASFGFLRLSHLPVLAAAGLTLTTAGELELSLFQGAAAQYILRGALPQGGDVLYLGPTIPPTLENLPPVFKLWRITDLDRWQNSGFSGDPGLVADLSGGAYPGSFPQFDAIVSTNWCSQLGADPHLLEGVSLYLDVCARPRGINLHFFSSVRHPAYFWTGPAHDYLRNRFLGSTDWPVLDELLTSPDIFIMSEAAYDRDWKPSALKTYTDFGQPLSLGLYWRKS